MLTFFFAALLAASPGYRAVQVDAARVTGTIRSFQGVNDGPVPVVRRLPDLTTQYRDLHIDIIRPHGMFGPVDIDSRWTHPNRIDQAAGASAARTVFPNWSADPQRPESYNFGPTDRVIQGIVGCGAEVYYPLARSFGADGTPPPDFDQYAEIVKHVAMHYNAGWANGYHDHIRYWEFWNEPDANPAWDPGFIQPFWSGTPAQFYQLYEKVARALKSLDASLKVGGPAIAAPDLSGPYREGFIAYCAAHRVPLDFFSWHHYFVSSYDPYDVVRIGRQIRGLLDAQGFRDAETYITEWNMGPGHNTMRRPNQPPAADAGFMGAVLTYLQESPVMRAMYYRADVGNESLFERNGSYRKKAYVFKTAGEMLDTPDKLETSGADTAGFAVVAGRSTDRNRIRILISNYEIPPECRFPARSRARMPRQDGIAYHDNRGYALTVTNLPWGDASYKATSYRVSAGDDFQPQSLPPGHGPTFELRRDLPPPAVELLVLERQ